jgi:hypothetical protein
MVDESVTKWKRKEEDNVDLKVVMEFHICILEFKVGK